jgi:NAD(P)-dependent dehydrogenase (short-subunit alcohol dehydrogenase family)
MSKSLAARSAVVTGAARGIGDAIAERLLADGANVFSLDKVAAAEPRAGVVYLEADVTDPSSVADVFKAIDARADGIDILVNNAGIQHVGLVGKISFADFSAVASTHLSGFSCARPKLSRGWRPAAKAARSSASHRPRRLSGSRDGRHIARQRLEFSSSPGR